MSAYCPECETDLDPSTGICPACRWDPYIAANIQAPAPDPRGDLSLTERYRGTRFDVTFQDGAASRSNTTVSRGRAFVLVTLAAGVGLYALVMTTLGPAF